MTLQDKAPALPEGPVFVPGQRQAALRTVDGACAVLPLAEALARLAGGRLPVVCHAPAIARRLRRERFAALDLLELFAFVRPATFCLPTPRGLAAALGLPAPVGLDAQAEALHDVMRRLLAMLAGHGERDSGLRSVARAMAAGGWPWGRFVLAALGEPMPEAGSVRSLVGLEIWRRMYAWSEHAPPPPPGHRAVAPAAARARLAALLGAESEARPEQADYASATTIAFGPGEKEDAPRLVLAEAGTGVGKTLGYIAPATLWAEGNGGAVWISTFTRNLQHQIDQELARAYPEPTTKRRKVVIRKGRENYLCLLNMEEAVRAVRLRAGDAVPLGLIARWAAHSGGGELVDGDLPGWLADIVGRGRIRALADRRGECLYTACSHYQKCVIESSIRRARRADIVVANHALVMIQAALGGGDDRFLPSHYVFDEGHHLFAAADSAFSAHLGGQETAELRRWLRGGESRTGRSRARGLRARAGDLVAGDEAREAALAKILRAAAKLPGEGWLRRLDEACPEGPAEAFLARIRTQVRARAAGRDGPYDLETDTREPVPGLGDAARALDAALAALLAPVRALAERLAARLDDEADDLDTATRQRIEAICRGLQRRAIRQIETWRAMLAALAEDTPDAFVDWFGITRAFGRDVDVGMHRHWVDPTIPFAEHVLARAQGVVVTSATLRDGSGDAEADWVAAEMRSGARHLPEPPVRAALLSPFDYPAQTRVIVVTDVRRNDLKQVAAAYRALFLAARGGALGLFTAISRLRAVHADIADALDAAGLTLLAQHVDGLDASTLVDIFRAEPDSCLLGTDAVRDGVDVPGRSLRLIVFERMPWPRPDILHRARRAAFGGTAYDDMLTRLRLKQAFGRLVRRASDRGVFVLLDPRMPSRLAGAFPEGVEIQRLGLADARALTEGFLAE